MRGHLGQDEGPRSHRALDERRQGLAQLLAVEHEGARLGRAIVAVEKFKEHHPLRSSDGRRERGIVRRIARSVEDQVKDHHLGLELDQALDQTGEHAPGPIARLRG